MHPELKRFSFRPGFTLLEILVAMFIFGVIMTTVYTSYTGALRNIKAAKETSGDYQKARITFDRIIQDLESAFIPDESGSSSNEGVFQMTGFIGKDMKTDGSDSDILSFNSEEHVSFIDDIVPVRTSITYYVEESEEEGGMILYRDDTPEFNKKPEGDRGYMLCDNLQSINFTYKDNKGEVHDNWDSTSDSNKGMLPVMISITLEFLKREDSEYPDRFTTSVRLPMAKGSNNEAS